MRLAVSAVAYLIGREPSPRRSCRVLCEDPANHFYRKPRCRCDGRISVACRGKTLDCLALLLLVELMEVPQLALAVGALSE
jgi:hypothetical protein